MAESEASDEAKAPDTDKAPIAADTKAAAETAAVQAVALNGAQVQAAQGIVREAAQGLLPRESAKAMLSLFFGLSEADAEKILGTVGKSFTPAEPTP